jgi:NAD(P)-dependent dehydrogenase (short-subunit alcohol dehydrogenase family)
MRVLVTGAANGIGAASAELLAQAGAQIVAVDLDAPHHADEWHRIDLSVPAEIDALPLTGQFDALVNAAGLPPRAGDEARILAVNHHGLVQLTERALPFLATGGAIVSIASKAGANWRENIAQMRRFQSVPVADLPAFVQAEGVDPVRAYDLSKEAVIYWTKTNTARLRDLGLRANTVSPAAIETRILPDFERAFGERAARGVALSGRAGTALEVAQVVAFLADPRSTWLRGADLAVDGGLHAMLEIAQLG